MNKFLENRKATKERGNFAILKKHPEYSKRFEGWFIEDLDTFAKLLVESFEKKEYVNMVEMMNHKRPNRFFLDIDSYVNDSILQQINKIVESYTGKKEKCLIWKAPPKNSCHMIWPEVIFTYIESYQLTKIIRKLCLADLIMYIPDAEKIDKGILPGSVPFRAFRIPLSIKRREVRPKIFYAQLENDNFTKDINLVDVVRNSFIYPFDVQHTKNTIDENWTMEDIEREKLKIDLQLFLSCHESNKKNANIATMPHKPTEYYKKKDGWYDIPFTEYEIFCKLILEAYDQEKHYSLVEILNHKKSNRFFLDIDHDLSDEQINEISKIVGKQYRYHVWHSPPKNSFHIIWPELVLSYMETFELSKRVNEYCKVDLGFFCENAEKIDNGEVRGSLPTRAFRIGFCSKSKRYKIPLSEEIDRMKILKESLIYGFL